jgi:hypothetical protein
MSDEYDEPVIEPEEVVAPEEPAVYGGKTVEQVAQEVLDGEWGGGQDRRRALAEAGFDPNEVKEAVLKILNGRT